MTTAAPPATVANKTPQNAMIDKILQPPGSHSSSNKRKGLHEKEVRKEKNKYKNIGAKEDEGRERDVAQTPVLPAPFFSLSAASCVGWPGSAPLLTRRRALCVPARRVQLTATCTRSVVDYFSVGHNSRSRSGLSSSGCALCLCSLCRLVDGGACCLCVCECVCASVYVCQVDFLIGLRSIDHLQNQPRSC